MFSVFELHHPQISSLLWEHEDPPQTIQTTGTGCHGAHAAEHTRLATTKQGTEKGFLCFASQR